MTDGRLKIVYLARRKPGMSREAFIARWRQHGALAMAQPRFINVARYVHADKIPGLSCPEPTRGFDGVGMLWFKSKSHFAARNQAVESQKIMEADELETFDRPVATTRQIVVERVVIPGPPTELKYLRFVWRAPRVDATEFIESWRGSEGERASLIGAFVSGYVINEPAERDGVRGSGLQCDVVEELWFDDIDSLRAGQQVLVQHSVTAGDVGTVLVVPARETVLLDRGKDQE